MFLLMEVKFQVKILSDSTLHHAPCNMYAHMLIEGYVLFYAIV